MDRIDSEENIFVEHIHTDLLLTEENSDHIEFLEEEEEVEEDVVDCSWRREDVFADENSSMNENMIRKLRSMV